MERHLMPASAETEPVEVKYGTSDCNAVVYGDLAVWAKPFTLNLYVGNSNVKSVAASVSSRITGLDNPAPSGSSTSHLVFNTKWSDTVVASCKLKDPTQVTQTTHNNVPTYRTIGPSKETQATIDQTIISQPVTTDVYEPTGSETQHQTITVRTDWKGSGSDETDYNHQYGTEYNSFHYDINTSGGGASYGNVPVSENGNGRSYHSWYTVTTPYDLYQNIYQDQQRIVIHQHVRSDTQTTYSYHHIEQERQRYEDQTKIEEVTSQRTVTTTYSFSKWTFHGTSSAASSSADFSITNIVANLAYDAVGTASSDDPEWTEISRRIIQDWTTTHTYYNPDWTTTHSYWTSEVSHDYGPWRPAKDLEGKWTNVGSEYGGEIYKESGDPDTPVSHITYGQWQAANITSATPIGTDHWIGSTHFWYTFDYWVEDDTGTTYSSGATYYYNGSAPENEVWFTAHWTRHREDDTSY